MADLQVVPEAPYNRDMLRLALGLRGLSIIELAQQIDESVMTMVRALGGREPSTEVMQRVAEHLRLPVTFFYREGEYRERDPRYPLDMFVMLPPAPKVTRERLVEMLAAIPDEDLDTLHAFMHALAVYPPNVSRLENDRAE